MHDQRGGVWAERSGPLPFARPTREDTPPDGAPALHCQGAPLNQSASPPQSTEVSGGDDRPRTHSLLDSLALDLIRVPDSRPGVRLCRDPTPRSSETTQRSLRLQ
jgi:hypothetical protein